MVQQGLIKALQGKKKKNEKMPDDYWEDLELKAVKTICLSLAPNIRYVMNETSALVLWVKLENICMLKSHN